MVHVAVWPPLLIVPLHPLENVVVRGAITETALLTEFVTYINPLLGLKAMSYRLKPTGMVATTVFVAGLIKDCVTNRCHVQKSVVGVKGNICWKRSHRQYYRGHNGVCCRVYHRDGVVTVVGGIHKPVVGVKGNIKWLA